MKSLFVPVVLWSYILTVVLAKRSWGVAYDKMIFAFDLSPSQASILPIGLNLLLACIGIPQSLAFIAALRRGATMSISRHIGSSLCTAATTMCLVGALIGGLRTREKVAMASGELLGKGDNDVFAAGKVVGGFYSNSNLGVVIELPKNWQPMSLNSIRRAKYSGAYAVSGGDSGRAEELAAARAGVYPLLAVHKYPENYAGYNPSLAINAYDKRALATGGMPSLGAYADSFLRVAESYRVLSGPSKEKFGTEQGYYVHLEGRFLAATVQQHVYLTQTETLYIALVASAIDDGDMPVMQESISTLRIHRSTKGK